MKRGDIVRVDWPGAGIHPSVIVTRTNLIPFLPRLNVALVTSRIRGLSTEVPVDEKNGIEHDSIVNCLNITTLEKREMSKPLGELNPDQLFHLDAALRIALQLDD